MNATRSRLVTVLASAILTVLVRVGAGEVTPELAAQVHAWVAHTLELLLYIGFTALRARVGGAEAGRPPLGCGCGRAPTPPPPAR